MVASERDPELPRVKRRSTWRTIPGVNTLHTPVVDRFDPPLELRPFDEVYQEVKAAMAAIEKRRFGRKRIK